MVLTDGEPEEIRTTLLDRPVGVLPEVPQEMGGARALATHDHRAACDTGRAHGVRALFDKPARACRIAAVPAGVTGACARQTPTRSIRGRRARGAERPASAEREDGRRRPSSISVATTRESSAALSRAGPSARAGERPAALARIHDASFPRAFHRVSLPSRQRQLDRAAHFRNAGVSLDGRTWDRTRDLPRVKGAGRFAASRLG